MLNRLKENVCTDALSKVCIIQKYYYTFFQSLLSLIVLGHKNKWRQCHSYLIISLVRHLFFTEWMKLKITAFAVLFNFPQWHNARIRFCKKSLNLLWRWNRGITYIYIYIYIHTYIHTCIHTYMHTCILHTHTHTTDRIILKTGLFLPTTPCT